MKHEILGAEGLREDIEGRILARYQAIQRVIQSTVDAQGAGWPLSDLTKSAEMLALALTDELPRRDGGGRTMAEQAAAMIVNALTDPHERGLSAWWGTPLGRACGWWLGGPDPDGPVSTSTAAAILGMSRQSVHEARNRGRLDLAGPTGVSAAAVRAHMQATYPLVIS